MTDETYNGWTNHATWHVKLTLDNEEPLYYQEQVWGENFLKKHLRGTFDLDKAAKAVNLYLVPLARKQVKAYLNGEPDETDYKSVNCHEIAQHLLDEAIENAAYKAGA